MYKRKETIISNISEVSNYIEGVDLYNSVLLRRLNNPGVEKEDYLINKYEYRPDLIAKDFYGDEKYQGLLMIQCPIPIEEFKSGLIISLIPKSVLDGIINSLT